LLTAVFSAQDQAKQMVSKMQTSRCVAARFLWVAKNLHKLFGSERVFRHLLVFPLQISV